MKAAATFDPPGAIAPLQAPEQLGPYRVLRRLGRGGMGVVYEAQHLETGERAAVKTVREALPSRRNAIQREILALSQLRHPGVVRIKEQGSSDDGTPWYAMDLVPGTPWRSLIGGSPAAPDQYPTLLTQLCALAEPLAHIHGEGLVHGDLKPDNILSGADGAPVLVDFGLTSRFGESSGREALALRALVGTPEYMAPEQWRGEPSDARTDLYAFGCLAYELFLGRPPFMGDREQLRRLHLEGQVPPLAPLLTGLPPGLDTLLGLLLAKSKEDRLGHASRLAHSLCTLGAQPPNLRAERPPRPYLFPPGLRGREGVPERVVGNLLHSGEGAPAVWIGGESGVGKTRLLLELAHSGQRGGLKVITAECTPNGPALMAFRPFLRAAHERLSLEAPELEATILGPRRATLARVEPTLAGTAPLPVLPTLDAEAERARVLHDLLATIAAFATQWPTFLLFDDLQWADELSLLALARLATEFPSAAELSLIGAFRSEEMQANLQTLLAVPGPQTLELGRLNSDAVSQMMADMLGLPPPSSFAAHLSHQSEGNPFFVAEYLRTALELGLLRLDGRGQWEVVTEAPEAYASLGLPNNLRELVARRLLALAPATLAVFEAAAVLGRQAPAEWILAAAQQTGSVGEGALVELLRHRVMEETEAGALRISHDKLREVAYERLPPERRRLLHGLAAELWQKAGGNPAELARHLEEAGRPAEALVAREVAAEAAITGGAYQEATHHLSRTLALAGDSKDYAPGRRARWHRRLAELKMYAGDLPEAIAEAGRALSLVGQPLPSRPGAYGLVLLGEAMRQIGHRLLPEGWYRDHQDQGPRVDAAEATALLSRIAFFQNQPLQIVAFALWSINQAERAGHYFAAARNYSGLGWVFGLAGASGWADAYFRRAKEAGTRAQDRGGLIFALTSEAVYRIGLGQWAEVEVLLDACEVPCAEARDPQGWELLTTLRGHPAYLQGNLQKAIRYHQAVLRSAKGRGNHQHVAWSHYCLGRAALAEGRAPEALRELAAAEAALVKVDDAMSVITCAGLRAQAHLALGELEEARVAADLARTRIGNAPPTVFLTMHGYQGIVETYLALAAAEKDRAQAQAHRRVAKLWLGRYRRMARTFPVAQPTCKYLTSVFKP
jgi:tetratricopeptide (TPR) repeat protein